MGFLSFVKVFGGWITLAVLYRKYRRDMKNLSADAWDALPDETKKLLWDKVRNGK